MKKIAKYFCDAIEGGEPLRWAILHASSPDEAVEQIRTFFAAR